MSAWPAWRCRSTVVWTMISWSVTLSPPQWLTCPIALSGRAFQLFDHGRRRPRGRSSGTGDSEVAHPASVAAERSRSSPEAGLRPRHRCDGALLSHRGPCPTTYMLDSVEHLLADHSLATERDPGIGMRVNSCRLIDDPGGAFAAMTRVLQARSSRHIRLFWCRHVADSGVRARHATPQQLVEALFRAPKSMGASEQGRREPRHRRRCRRSPRPP